MNQQNQMDQTTCTYHGMSILDVSVGHHHDHDHVSPTDTLNNECYIAINGGRGSPAQQLQWQQQRRCATFAAVVLRMFLFEDITSAPPNPKVTGLALCLIARGTVAMSKIFLGPALLHLAEEALVCDNGGLSCWVYRMRPTLLLTNIVLFGRLLLSALTPLFGAIANPTPQCLWVGQISVSIHTMVKGVKAFVGRFIWLVVLALQVANIPGNNA